MQTFLQQPNEPTQLYAIRSGMRCLREEHRKAAGFLSGTLVADLGDYLTCMEHELRFFEEYPPSTLSTAQQRRVEQLCRYALNLLSAGQCDETASAGQPLRRAIAQLLLFIKEDFGKLGRQRSLNAVYPEN